MASENTPTSTADTSASTATTSANIAAIQRSYAGFRERDVAAVLSVMHPEVEWVHPDGMAAYGLGGTKLGHAGIREFLARVPSVLGGMRLNPREFIEQGDRVVVFGTREVTSRGGNTATLNFVHSWTMRDGKATRMEDIFDTVAFHELIESDARAVREPGLAPSHEPSHEPTPALVGS